MPRMRNAVLFALTAALLSPFCQAQQTPAAQFRADFSKGIELADDKMVDKAVKRAPGEALRFYEDIYQEKQAGKESAHAQVLALQNSWKRLFENGDTLERLDRWLSGADQTRLQSLRSSRDNEWKVWSDYSDRVAKGVVRADHQKSLENYLIVANNAVLLGHAVHLANLYQTAAVIANKVPERTLDDRRAALGICEQFLEARKSWNFTFDEHYLRHVEYVKAEKGRIEEEAKKGDKRKAEGYDPNAKGIDSLVMAGAVEQKHAFKFEALPNLDELEYGPRNGPVAPLWQLVSLAEAGTSRVIPGFKRRELYLARTALSKYAVSLLSNDNKGAVEVEVNNKFKVSTFWLDAEKKLPYAMGFWIGSDREMINEAECNYETSEKVANVYFRSAASWKGVLGTEPVVFYDDNCSGNPGDGNPMDPQFKSMLLGDSEQGTVVPMFDSMRIGKGPRQPYSEFIKLPTGWHYMKKANGDEVGLRPLNPEYVKTGKIKLVWNGPKPTAPVQLVVQGSGDYKTAVFDLASGKEIEVPAAQYSVIFGRLLSGKGPRSQTAALYQGNSKPFTVEPGKVFELKMGGPFVLQFVRRGDENSSIDATKILVAESSGCVMGEWHGISLACEVLAAKEADGKGQKVVGKFVRFTDPELVNKAAAKHSTLGLQAACFPMPDNYRDGELVLAVKPGAPGMKLALFIKKHPFFGPMQSPWQ